MKNMKLIRQSPRPMLCPVCNTGRIIDRAPGVDASSVMLHAPQQAEAAQFFCKCPKCKQQIGISLRAS